MGDVLALAPGSGVAIFAESADSVAASAQMEVMRRRLLRLAFDVHDGPMQDLIGITWRLRSVRDQAISEAKRGEFVGLAVAFDDFAEDLGSIEKGLRSLMFSLEHDSGSDSSVRVLVDEHVASFERHFAARVEVVVAGDIEPRTDSQRIAIERVLRESLSNIAKHSHAEHVEISLRGTDELIVLQIRDDGSGFAASTATTDKGTQQIGVRAMRERLRLLGGELTIDSRVGGPTVVTAQILKWQAQEIVAPSRVAMTSGNY